MCVCTPLTDVVIEAAVARTPADIPLQTVTAQVRRMDGLSDAMMLLELVTPRTNRLRFLAGQSATLCVGGTRTPLPIASCPCEERRLHFHVRRIAGNRFSDYAFDRLRIGDAVEVGERSLRIAAVLLEDPETAVGFLNLGPRVILNRQDLESTGLIQVGSRATYRLGVAGEPPAVAAFRAQAQRALGPGQRVDHVRDARPEVRTALERAEKFLGLSALLSVLLAAVAVGLAARRYLRRHLDSCAIMRCLGASQGLILGLHIQQFAVLGAIASAIGCAVGCAACDQDMAIRHLFLHP